MTGDATSPTSAGTATDDVGEPARRSVIGGASAAIVSQGVVAASSLVLQWLALRELGASGLGVFAILSNGLVVTAAALHTGWVGDSLVILDRHDPPIRRALFTVSGISAIASFAFGLGGALVFTDLGVRSAALFGVALLLWLVEETGRRLMMARHEFVALVVNDVVFAVGSLGSTALVMVTSRLTMDWLIVSILVGSVLSIAAAVVQLPSHEFRPPDRGPTALRQLTAFSAWRSGQLTMRPLGMLLTRVAVSVLVSPAALGIMEAGRLIIAPILTAAAGFGGFSLPYFTRHRNEHRLTMSLVYKFAGVSAVAAAVYIPVAFVVAPVFERISKSGDISALLIVSWCVYAIAYSANVPIVNALTALMHSRVVFWGRCVDSVVIVVLSVIVVSVSDVDLVPMAMTVGMGIGTVVPLVWLRRNGLLPTVAEPTGQR